MELTKIRGFVQEFNEEKVICMLLIDEDQEYYETREFKVYPLFAKMDLFEHKNILIEIEHEGNSQTIRCLESNESKFQQIFNAWGYGQ
jgi:hypothetical protein